MRSATINRKTAETDIQLTLTLDGSGTSTIDSGCGFLDHMLTLFSRHGGFDVTLSCKGDTNVDDHHSCEDIGIALGSAFKAALGDFRGICRYGSMLLPMDEALVQVVLDVSGRACLVFDMPLPTQKVGTFDTELVEEFFLGFCRNLGLTLHLHEIAGSNTHHIIEAAFKGFGRALSQAVAIDAKNPNVIPSTKGVL